MQRVFTLFEGGKLKGQQTDKMKGAEILKTVDGKFSAKLQHFKMLQGLNMSENMLCQYGCMHISCMYVCMDGGRMDGWHPYS